MRYHVSYKRYIFLLWCVISTQHLHCADHVVTFFLKPSFIHQQTQDDNQPTINEPILVTYAGYLDSSDNNGQVIFPRLTGSASFVLIITPLIQPVFMLGNTIHHWQLVNTLSYKAFTIQKMGRAPSEYWQVAEHTIEDDIIPLNGIVILGDPQDFSVTMGKTSANDQPQFILPSVLVHRYTAGYKNSSVIRVMAIKEFFGGLSTLSKQQREGYLSTLSLPR